MIMMESCDLREFKPDSRVLLHRALNLMRECEKYNIDYNSYICVDDFMEVINILECCLDHKDNSKILRREYE